METVKDLIKKFGENNYHLNADRMNNNYEHVMQSIQSCDDIMETLNMCDKSKIAIACSTMAKYQTFEIRKSSSDSVIMFAHTYMEIDNDDNDMTVYETISKFIQETRNNLARRRQELESEVQW